MVLTLFNNKLLIALYPIDIQLPTRKFAFGFFPIFTLSKLQVTISLSFFSTVVLATNLKKSLILKIKSRIPQTARHLQIILTFINELPRCKHTGHHTPRRLFFLKNIFRCKHREILLD